MRRWQITKTILFIVLVPGTVVIYLPVFLLGLGRPLPVPAPSLVSVFAGALWVCGMGLVISCALRFATEGQGTPAPIDPPKVLVVGGIYRHTRNPMYLGIVCALFAESLLFSRTVLGVFALAFFLGSHLFIILYEEPHLRRTFGAQYNLYCRAVPRWGLVRRRSGRPDGNL